VRTTGWGGRLRGGGARFPRLWESVFGVSCFGFQRVTGGETLEEVRFWGEGAWGGGIMGGGSESSREKNLTDKRIILF